MTTEETLRAIVSVCETYDRATFALLDIEDLAKAGLVELERRES